MSRQHVGISIIQSVYQSCFTQEIIIKLKNSRIKSKLEIHSHALLINVMLVSKEKIKSLLTCNLLYADAARGHTTVNACRGCP